ncbi:hypothetical protein KJ656_13375 [bacterium]|nr:hypothetical protein [bacterium]
MAKCIGEIEFGYTGEELTVSINGFTKHYPYQTWANTIFTELKQNPNFRLKRKYLSYPQLLNILEIWDTISKDNPGHIDRSKKPTILEYFPGEISLLLDHINLKYYNKSIHIDVKFIESVLREWDMILLDHMSEHGW